MEITRSVLLPYPASFVFDIVNDIACYPEFVPWCTHTSVHETSDQHMLATVAFATKGINESFTTRNSLARPSEIRLALQSGPLKNFSGCWTFDRLGDDAGCRVTLAVEFGLTGPLRVLGRAMSGSLGRTIDRIMDAFCERAQMLARTNAD